MKYPARPDNASYAKAQIFSGWKLSATQAEELEKELEPTPNDLSKRLLLVGYYGQHVYTSDKARRQHRKHFLRVLRDAPESAVSDSHLSCVFPTEPAYHQAEKLWQEHLRQQPTNLRILQNAADFFLLRNTRLAARLFKKAQSLDAKSFHWAECLGHLYSLSSLTRHGRARRVAGKRWLQQMEHAFALAKNKRTRFEFLDDLAKAALTTGEFERANRYAHRLLRQAARLQDDADRSDAIHQGNIVLGKLALEKGDVRGAKRRLLMAGQVTKSPVLYSFGPNLRLAKQLLERGEREVVVEYFQLCSNFWDSGREKLKKWILILQSGRSPDLGIHLDH